jgi:hypothetical protein
MADWRRVFAPIIAAMPRDVLEDLVVPLHPVAGNRLDI